MKELGATVLLKVPPELEELGRAILSIDRVLPREETHLDFDFYIHTMSLPGAFGTTNGVACGSGVALGEGATAGVFAGEGDCVDGVVGPGEAGGLVCARSSPPQHDSTTNAESKRTPVFVVSSIISFENVE